MTFDPNLEDVRNYFDKALKAHGTTPKGADWNSEQSQNIRFDQLLRIIDPSSPFSILDYGSGYGGLVEYLMALKLPFTQYIGFDILESMVEVGRQLFTGNPSICFTSKIEGVPQIDYTIASGVFNFRGQCSYEEWTQYTIQCLEKINSLSRKGFSSNFLTKYSDEDRMRSDLYYADPCFLFDYCKTHFSKNVALLHDYKLYDFTILVRKD